jgi:translocation and assembly module TamB
MAQEPFLDSDMTLKGHIDFPALEDIAVLLEPWGIGKGSVALSMDVSGTWNQPEGHIHFEVNEIEPPDTMRQYMDSAVNFSGDIAALGGTIVLQAAKLESTQYTAQASGSWKHGISVKELLQKSKAELKGEVKADAKVKLKDLNFLRRKLPWLRRLEGDMQGELHLAGPVTKPALKGSFSLKDGEASHTFNFPMLSAVNLVGEFDEHSISIENMRAEVGGSPVNLSGRINKDKETVVVNLHVDGKNVLLFRNNDMRMRGDVQLDVSGPLDRLAIKGTTGLTGGYYTRNIDFLGMLGSSSAPVSEGAGFLFSFPDPPLNDAVIDIRITTIEPFRIRNNLIRGVLRPELSLKGTGELPFLLGNVYIDSSRVILPSGRLQVQSGLLRFLEEEPDRPQLDLLAQSKVLGYDINVVTRGPIDDPVITLSSSPALPNDELMLLLLTGQPPKEDAAGGAKGSGTTNVMVYLGRDFLNKWLEDESGASDETILDRFELDFGRNITKSGEQTVESTFRLSEYTTGTGKIYYLTGEKDKYDAYNYGVRLVFSFE